MIIPSYLTKGLEFDEKLGIILPIEGFTKEQVKQNILEYQNLDVNVELNTK